MISDVESLVHGKTWEEMEVGSAFRTASRTVTETDTSFAFLTNGYPLSGYDYTRLGVNRTINIANLGNDLAA